MSEDIIPEADRLSDKWIIGREAKKSKLIVIGSIAELDSSEVKDRKLEIINNLTFSQTLEHLIA